MTHTELLAALEAATGPGRELDAAIWLAIHRPNYKYPRQVMNRTPSSYAEAVERHTVSVDRGITAPAYTASLDAALTLVPEGWFLDGLREGRKRITYATDRHEPLGWFQSELQYIDGGRLIRERAKSFALALCIAALRARGEE